MTIYLPNEIAKKYGINSVLYKKKKDKVYYFKVDSIQFCGFKNSKTHVKFSGKVIKVKSV